MVVPSILIEFNYFKAAVWAVGRPKLCNYSIIKMGLSIKKSIIRLVKLFSAW
jgi:hypothetical protein